MAATPKPVRKMIKKALTHQRKENKEQSKELSSPKHKEFYFGPKAKKEYAETTRKVVRELGMGKIRKK
jgi:hypothetical protein